MCMYVCMCMFVYACKYVILLLKPSNWPLNGLLEKLKAAVSKQTQLKTHYSRKEIKKWTTTTELNNNSFTLPLPYQCLHFTVMRATKVPARVCVRINEHVLVSFAFVFASQCKFILNICKCCFCYSSVRKIHMLVVIHHSIRQFSCLVIRQSLALISHIFNDRLATVDFN